MSGIVGRLKMYATSAITILPSRFVERVEFAAGLALGKGWDAPLSKEVAAALTLLLPQQKDQLVVLDIGAHHGDWSHAMLAAAPRAQIYAFEPSALTFEELANRFSSDPRLQPVRRALGNRAGRIQLWANDSGSPIASVYRRDLGYLGIDFDLVEEVEVSTLDEWCASWNLRPSIIKIDVEGHELAILEGAPHALKYACVIQFEFGGTAIDAGVHFRDLYNLLTQNNYRIFRLTPRGLLPIKSYSERQESYLYMNYFAQRTS